MEAFQALRSAQIPLRLNTVIRNNDVPHIREILDWFQQEIYQNEPSASIYHTFSFEREGPAGTVGSCGGAHSLSELDHYIGELKSFDASGYQLYEIALRNKLASGGTFYKCSSGVKRIAVGPDGRVYPCQGFVDTKLDMGSILSPDFDHRETSISQCMAGRNIATLLPCRNCVFSALCPHNVDCAARAHYTLGGLTQIDVNGMCRVGFDLMDKILFESDLLFELGASKRLPSVLKEKA
jgi:radical SAM protein with 4Fe4S-binding SPASM domain